MFNRDPKTAKIGKEILPFEMGYLPEFFQKKAEVELHDTPEKRKQNLYEIRELMKSDKTFANDHYEDDFLMLFLLSRKHNVHKAFKQLKNFITFKKKNAELFGNMKFESLSVGTRKKIINLLPLRCQDGCVIGLIKIPNWEPSTFPVEVVKRFYVLLFAEALQDPMTQVNGFKVIIDLDTNPFKHVRHLTPQNLYLLYYTMTDCLPGRFKKIHCINTNFAGRAAWFIIKPFLSEKMKNRIHFHSDPKELLEHFPRATIPEEYGGDLKHYDTTDWLRRASDADSLNKVLNESIKPKTIILEQNGIKA